MIIKKFLAKNVHGYLNYDIDFNDRLTFLIGINGTGKTSVLKLILGLISPSFNYLNSIEFESAEIECYENTRGTFRISANPTETNEISLTLNRGDEPPIIGRLIKTTIQQAGEYDPEEVNEKMRSIIEFFDQQAVVKEIKNLTTPLFLGLDRRVYQGQQIDRMRQNFLWRKKYRHFAQIDPLNLSLIDMQEVIFDYVRIIASRQPKINQDFKNKILLQSFEFLDSQELNIIKDFKELKEKRKMHWMHLTI
jgi:predicted ATP-dependent endonuclease of OLD family